MSHPEATTPEAHVVEEHVEPVHEESPGLTQREFLKKLVGSAAGLTGLAAAGTLLTPKPAEAAYTPAGSPYPAYLPGDQITTNVHVNGSAAIRGPRPWLDVTAFGASGDWTTGADAPVAAALASTAGSVVLYFPAGIYAFASPVNISNRHVTLMGAGRGVTYFYFYPGAGLNFTMWDPGKITIRDIHLQTGGANAHPAIRITAAWAGGLPTSQPHIHDVWINTVNPGAYWAKGIELIGAAGGMIERFEIDCGTKAGSTHGIHLRGGSAITNIASGLIANTAVGIEASDQYTEGVYFRGIEVLGANTGYLLSAPGPGSAISDCHAAVTQYGIRIIDHGDMALVGNLLYGEPGWVGIHAHGTGVNPNTGIVDGVYGAHNLRIMGNQLTGVGTGISLSGYARNGVIQGNLIDGATSGNGIVLSGSNVTGQVAINNRIAGTSPPTTNTGVGNTTSPNY
jgi:hypothetical protein